MSGCEREAITLDLYGRTLGVRMCSALHKEISHEYNTLSTCFIALLHFFMWTLLVKSKVCENDRQFTAISVKGDGLFRTDFTDPYRKSSSIVY